MPFEIPDNIHPQVAPLAWMIGTWRGNGNGDYPTIEPFTFRQEVTFHQDGRPFIYYFSRSWITDAEGEMVSEGAQESGFLRPQEDRSLEMVVCHNSGVAEVWVGEIHPKQPRFEVITDAVLRTASSEDYTAGKRLYGYVEGDLLYAVDAVMGGHEMQPHTWGRLQRQ